jgi:hypothetical protein
MPEVTAFIDENPFLNGRIVSDQFTEQGFPVPAAIKSHISNAIKGRTEVIETIIEQKFQDNIIDDNFVNSLPTVELRRKALEFKEEQDNRRFGPNYAGIKKSFIGDARLLTKINDGGSNTSQTYQVYAEVIKQYDRFIDEGFTPEEAAGQVNTLIQEVRSGGANTSNPFYYTDGENNRRIFPNIESSGVERQERRNLVDKKLLTYGIEVLDKPYLVATEQEMDATYLSAQKGNTIYPPEVLRVSEKFKIKPSEAYNTIRKAQNLVTGENKPMLAPNPILQLVDQAEAKVRKLFQSGNRKMIERGGASMGLSALPLRRSMGGDGSAPGAYTNQERAFIETIMDSEGAGFNTVYGGAVVPELTQMTLGELYDAIKLGGTDAIPARLGGGKIPFKKDQYNSSASGFLQLMPDTLLDLMKTGKYNEDTVFTPEVQMSMALDLAKRAGIDVNNLTLEGMRKAGGIWASLTPQYGQTSTTANQSYDKFLNYLNKYR